MRRVTAITGLLLVAAGLAAFLWKTVGLDIPLVPSSPEGLWQVELIITARGDGSRGSVRIALPATEPGQVIFDQRATADRLQHSVRPGEGGATGVWSGRFEGVHTIEYAFRAELYRLALELPSGGAEAPPAETAAAWGGSSAEFPADAPQIRELLDRLALPAAADVGGRINRIYNFVSDEIATVETAGSDALMSAALREGSPRGKARLLVSLLRAAGVPARSVSGLQLRENAPPLAKVWVEAFAGGAWLPMSPSDGFFASRPGDLLTLRRPDGEAVEAIGVEAIGHRFDALRQTLRPEELATLMVPTNPLLARISLYRLPLPTQQALRTLLLLPLGALMVALFRNVIGVPTYGTFLPILIALALRQSSLAFGLALVAFVVVLGTASRFVFHQLRLLMVPRLSIVLCVVVLTITGYALLGRETGERDFFGAVLFPMVILTTLIERFSITISEEGLRPALEQAAYSTLVAVATYPVFTSSLAEHVMFSFPELVVTVMGVLVLIGGYTGYRLFDLIRFRMFAREKPGVAS
jgi:hypothetical protein